MESITAEAKVTLEKTETLEHHPDNPRIGHVPAIVDSIRQNGWFGTLIGQRSTRYILAGNHRLKAARELQIAKVPVVWIDVDDDRAKKILLADNRTSDLAVYDDDALATLLESVISSQESLKGTGWTEYDVERLLEKARAPAPTDWDEYDNTLADQNTKERGTNAASKDGLRAVICPKCGHHIEL